MEMRDQIGKLTDELGLEFDENGKFVINIINTDDYKVIAENLSYGVIQELLQHQVDNENYEGAEVLQKVIDIKDGLQKVQRD
jgi:uncharacterized protein (DUF1919 family)